MFSIPLSSSSSLMLRWCAPRLLLQPNHPQLKPNSNTYKKIPAGFAALSRRSSCSMDEEKLPSLTRKQVTARISKISSFSAELLEMHSEEPLLHIIFIPGNPGIVSFYKDFVEAMYELLEEKASITAIGHIAHTRKDYERGRLFSLQEQINHKVDFIKQYLESNGPPIILVGHSIGSYICLEVFKRLQQQVKFVVGLYPFLTLNKESLIQSQIGMVARSSILSASISYVVSLLSLLPTWLSSAIARQLIVKSWSSTAIDVACSHLLQYHTVRNALFLAMTEFTELSKEPDWSFMEKKQDQIAFLFGTDDHWGPLSVFKVISRRVPGIALSLEEEGHTHAFSCTKAGSIWVARYVAALTRSQIPNL